MLFSLHNSSEVTDLLKNRPLIRSVIYAFCTLLLICLVGVGLARVNNVRVAVAPVRMPKVKIIWKQNVGNVEDIAFADDNRCFCLVSPDGTVCCYGEDGAIRYSSLVPYADKAVLSPRGDFALAYSHKDSVHNELTFLDKHGNEHWSMHVTGAVWCADVCDTDDGACFVVGTGQDYIYVIDIGPRKRSYRRWRVPGAVISVAFDSRGESVFFGTWQDSAVGRATLRGRRLWEDSAQPASLQYVEHLQSSSRLFVRSTPNCSILDGAFWMMNDDGGRLWRGAVGCAEDTRVMSSPNGLYVCLGYRRRIEHEGKSALEKHITLYDAIGRRIWDKGSLFLQIEPVVVTSTGCVIAVDNENSLFLMGASGKLDPFVKLPAPVARSCGSNDGSRVLLDCRDGTLYMFGIL